MSRWTGPLAAAVALVFTALALSAGRSGSSAQAAGSLRAGAAAVDVTPREFPLNMPGGFSENLAHGAHDPLHARALVLDDSATRLAMVVVDNLGLARETVDEAKKRAAARCGIPVERMLICSTHTHSAPASNVTQGDGPAVAYRKLLVDGIAESIVRAHGVLRPAALGYGSAPLPEEVFNRRWFLKPGKMTPNPFGKMDRVRMNPGTSPDVLDRPAGPTDPEFSAFSVREAGSQAPLALFANYALHYVGGTPPRMVSADYFGEFARLMPSRVRGGPMFVAMLSNGASGDINNIPFLVGRAPREPFEQIRIVAGRAADAAWQIQSAAAHSAGVRLGMREREVSLRIRYPTPEQVSAARAVLAVQDEAEKAKLPRLADAYARRVLSLAEGPKTVSAQIQAIRIGDVGVCAIPFETFVEIGLELKRRSPFRRTMVIGLANARHGYLPTPEHHELGGYETWLGTNWVQEDTSVILTRHLLEMLGELATEGT